MGRLIEDSEKMKGKSFEKVAPKEVGVLDMVIAFDTTGSMAEYIGAVRKEVADLIPVYSQTMRIFVWA